MGEARPIGAARGVFGRSAHGAGVLIVLSGRGGTLGSMPAWSQVLDKDQIARIGANLEQFAIPDKAKRQD